MARGYRPTSDPAWTHEHAFQGCMRKCKSCDAEWAVYCHSAKKRMCSTCRAGANRVIDRAYQAKKRRLAKRNKQQDERNRAWKVVKESPEWQASKEAERRAEARRRNGLG